MTNAIKFEVSDRLIAAKKANPYMNFYANPLYAEALVSGAVSVEQLDQFTGDELDLLHDHFGQYAAMAGLTNEDPVGPLNPLFWVDVKTGKDAVAMYEKARKQILLYMISRFA